MDGFQGALFSQDGADDQITLAQYAEQAYLDYAVSVVRGRALPELTDGQKPVQRRILFAMRAMGLGSDAKPVKSARVVGDVLGKYHPHGDQAAYDAMVRMAQDFTLRYPLIDGHGNFGSRDGDNAAAMRYTEARLTPFAKILLDELDEGTVDFIPNYDGSQREPVTLPARLPVMLLNGASGIAVGMATEIPSHNLREVAKACVELLRKPLLSEQDLYNIIPGPDFAAGGHIITSPDDIASIYSSGRGSIKVRAKWVFEEMARGQWQCVITELPPGVSSQKILEEIEEATNPKPRANRKGLTTQQQQTRALMLNLLDTVRDEAGKDDAVRLVFEPRSSRVDRDEFINTLLAQTSLEVNVSLNLVCLGLDGRPAQRSLLEILKQWLEFRSSTVRLRTQFRLNKVSDRIHVLEGRMVVYLNVDKVIQTIRESDDPRKSLMQRFSLSERQAEDILEMRLRQLARLEGIRIEQELEKQRIEESNLKELLENEKAFKRLIIKELESDAKAYGDDRRTLIQVAERAVLETRVPDEPVTAVISQKGWLRSRQGHGHDKQQFGFKAGDSMYDTIECRTTDDLLAISNDGRVYTIAVADLPSARGDGQPVTSMIDLEPGSKVKHYILGTTNQKYIFSTAKGLGFIATVDNMSTRQRSGKQFFNLKSDTLLKPFAISDDHTHVVVYSKQGRLLCFEVSELRVLDNGGRGTKLIELNHDDAISQVVAIGENGLELSGVYRRKYRVDCIDMEALEPYITRRARKGRVLEARIKNPVLGAA